jgi:hypothetical protein
MTFSGLFAGNERKQKEQQMREEGRLPPVNLSRLNGPCCTKEGSRNFTLQIGIYASLVM